jgi:hypothetical protein
MSYPATLLPQHQQVMRASAVSPEVCRQRGYVSIDSRAQLKRFSRGFSNKSPLPGFLIPLRRADGSVWGYQYLADVPRVMDSGRTRKYETPFRQRNGIDFPAGMAEAWVDPGTALLVTEGSKKADSAVTVGIACVALPGVDGWRGTNAKGGKLAVPDWNDIALNGRRVVLAFDSDACRKPDVQRALRSLAGYLATKGASVEYLHLPDPDDGKCGLDDYLAAEGAGGIWSLVRPEPPFAADAKTVNSATAALVSATSATSATSVAWDGDLAGLLDDVRAFLGRFVAYPHEHAGIAHTLWIAHAHQMDAWESTPGSRSSPRSLAPARRARWK